MRLPWPWPDRRLGVLLVCSANICRSPMAQALLEHKLARQNLLELFRTASAGTRVALKGHPPDPRVLEVLAGHGIPAPRTRSRAVRSRDFERNAYVVAMDRDNLEDLHSHCPEPLRHRLLMLGDFLDPPSATGIPDPYFGNLEGFERVFGLLDQALERFVGQVLLS